MSESKFISAAEFLEDFKGEDQYGAVAQVFEIMPTNSIIVSSEGSDLEFQIATTLSDLFVAENSYEVQTDIGTFFVESASVGPCFGQIPLACSKIFRVYWPSSEGGNAPPVYVLTDSYAKA